MPLSHAAVPAHHLLRLPGTVIGFKQTTATRVRALVRARLGYLYYLPAVRGMRCYQTVNTPQQELGSFIVLSKIKARSFVANIVSEQSLLPSVLRAPGTGARLSILPDRVQLQLARKRQLVLPLTAIGQIGVNAIHAHRHTCLGGAGEHRRANYKPHVRMRAKNPTARLTLRARLKYYNSR